MKRSDEAMNTNEQTTINDRVQQVINHYNFNRSSFSKEIGLSSSMTIANIVGSRKSKPGYDVLRKIAERFPINLNWLILGEGPMLRDAESDRLEVEKIEVKEIVEVILETPEEFEKNPAFAKYLESKCYKAVIEHQDEMLLKFKKSGLD